MTVSQRSRFLLVGSCITPLATGFPKMELWKIQKEARAAGQVVLAYDPGFVFLGLVVQGVVFLIAGLVSMVINFRHAR